MTESDNMNRRDFLRGLTAGTLTISGLVVEEITAGAQAKKKPVAAAKPAAPSAPPKPPVNCAVIGLGPQGREILTALSKMGSEAPVLSICDTYSILNYIKKAQVIVPKAQFTKDYRAALDNKNIQAVIIATPSHLHKQIALDAIQAGKHVYCEAPFSQDLDEAKVIAQAGMASKTMFQPGLQVRCSAQAEHVHHFILAANLGKIVGGRAQWHKQSSWRSISGNPEREAALNWRLKRATSSGLLGEVGIHQIDTASWYLNALPVSVTAYGSIQQYKDDREVADNVQAIFEYPDEVRYVYDATLTSSFDDSYELFFGTDATVMLRDQRGWMFKEAGSNQLGWEVFARKDQMQIGRPEKGSGLSIGSGIALVADATKQLALGKTELTNDPTKTSLFYSLTSFLDSVRAGKRVPVKEPGRDNPHPPLTPTALDGYRANVVAVKANEAALTGSKIVFQKEWFEL
jgi:predicted dehydrogenase